MATKTKKRQTREQQPWDDCKVAFGIDDDHLVERPAWGQAELRGVARLAAGRPAVEQAVEKLDGSGARWVAVFRVRGVPSVRDGKLVVEVLTRIGAITGEPS